MREAMTREEIIRALRQARQDKDLSQQEVGERMGLAPSAAQGGIARWELGKREPSASNLTAWAEALGLEVVVQPKPGRGVSAKQGE